MSMRGSPIRGLQPNVKEFTLQNYALNSENQRLTQIIIAKNEEIQTLVEVNARLKNNYEAQATAYRRTIESLENQLGQSQNTRQADFKQIREKYNKLTTQQMSNLKNTHTNEIQFLFKQIAQLRASIETYNSKLSVKDHEIITIKQSYERQLSMATADINTLNKKIIQLQDDRMKEVRDLTNRRQLQKSRTNGVVNSRKENSQYIQKQLRKLSEEVLEKTIAIENSNRDLMKEKKRHEETSKTLNKKIDQITQDADDKLNQTQERFLKIQKILKQEIIDFKEKQIRLLNQNQTLKSNLISIKNQIQSKDSVIKSKSQEIQNIKANQQKMRQDHINEINNLMKERRKRSSKSNLGSSRSLNSSLKESAIIANTPQPDQLNGKLGNFLPIVKQQISPQRKDISQQLSQSNIMQEDDNELARAIYHYDSIIDELKKSHQMELQYYKLSLDKSTGRLKQKQNQLEDVLTRFSPLVKIHADEKSLEEDRRDRIERHWKADLSILEVMLRKYKIRTF